MIIVLNDDDIWANSSDGTAKFVVVGNDPVNSVTLIPSSALLLNVNEPVPSSNTLSKSLYEPLICSKSFSDAIKEEVNCSPPEMLNGESIEYPFIPLLAIKDG